MTDTDTTLATIDSVLEEDEGQSTDALDAEVVSDEVETDTAEATPAPKTRRTRKPKGEVEAQDVPAPAPVAEKSSFTTAKARKHTDKLKGSVEVAAELFIEAYQGRIWLALDYPSWAEYLNGEIGELRPRLPKARRLELVGTMKNEAKMSQQAIADALGVDQRTISNDLRDLRGEAEANGEEGPTNETVGLDGGNYSNATPRPTRTKEFVDRVTDAVDGVWKAVGKLTDLRAEDEWASEGGRIANRHRSDLLRLSQEFAALASTLQTTEEFDSGEGGEG